MSANDDKGSGKETTPPDTPGATADRDVPETPPLLAEQKANAADAGANEAMPQGTNLLTQPAKEPPKELYDTAGFDTELPGFCSVLDGEYQLFNSESDFQIFMTHMSSEIPLQRLVAAKSLGPSSRRFGLKATLHAVVPKVATVAQDKEMVIRQTTADQLGKFCKYMAEASNDSPDIHYVIIRDILPCIQAMLLDALEVRLAAGRSLITIAKILSQDEVFEHVLKIVLHMAHDDSDDHKITALPLIGQLAPICGRQVCMSYLSQDLHALSQDNSFRVRKATVQYFGPICEQVGHDHTEKTLLPIYLTLTKDAIWSVRKGCVESLVDISHAVSKTSKPKLIEVMRGFLQDNSRWVRNTAYELLGPFIATLTSDLISKDFLWYYTNIPNLKPNEADTESSNHCAFNFPAVVLTLGPTRWPELLETYNSLVRKTFKTRKTLACSLHELGKILGTEITERDLISPLDIFLKDIDDIREGVVRKFAQLLKCVSPTKREEYLATLWELASESDTNWRFRLLLASQLETLVFLYSPTIVSEQLVPLAFQLCDDKMSDVRYEAVKAVGHILDVLVKHGQESQVHDVLRKIHMMSSNRTYTKRQLYATLCSHCVNVVSDEMFEKNLLAELCKMDKDPISNVRLTVARCIHRDFLNHPKWGRHQAIMDCVATLRDDPQDVDVVRYFLTDEEVEEYIKKQKALRKQQEQDELNHLLKSTDSDSDTGDDSSSSSSEYHDIASKPEDKDKDKSKPSEHPSETELDNPGAGDAEEATEPLESADQSTTNEDESKDKPPT